MYLVYLIVLFAVIFGLHELFRKVPVLVYPVFLVVPAVILLLPEEQTGLTDWFIIAKTFTIVVYLLLIQITRSFSKLQNSRVMMGIIYAMLIINIFEASGNDLKAAIAQDSLGLFISAAAGVVLCLTIPLLKDMRIDTGTSFKDLEWDMPRLWIITYTLWNWTYIYGQYGDGAMVHFAVLAVPLIVGMRNPKVWLQARVITLATYMMIRPFAVEHIQKIYHDYHPPVLVLQLATLVLTIACIVYFLADRRRKNGGVVSLAAGKLLPES